MINTESTLLDEMFDNGFTSEEIVYIFFYGTFLFLYAGGSQMLVGGPPHHD